MAERPFKDKGWMELIWDGQHHVQHEKAVVMAWLENDALIPNLCLPTSWQLQLAAVSSQISLTKASMRKQLANGREPLSCSEKA